MPAMLGAVSTHTPRQSKVFGTWVRVRVRVRVRVSVRVRVRTLTLTLTLTSER